MQYNFNESVQEYEQANPQSSTNWFKFQEGQNKIRILSKGEVLAEHFKLGVCYGREKGCPFHTEQYTLTPARAKWLMWIIDRGDNKIKLAKMPYKIIKGIADLQNSEDFAFTEIPMPFDITITATKAGTKEVEYSILPSVRQISLTEEEQKEYDEQNSVEEIVQKMKDKQKEKIDRDPEFQAKREELRQDLESNDGEIKETIEYPEDEIDPNQIPF